MRNPQITLALGGGGARGVAHLGAIEVLVGAGFAVEHVVGVSIGSLVGAMFAFEPDIQSIQRRALAYLMSSSFQKHQQTLFGAHPHPGETSTGGMFTWYERVKAYLRANRLFQRVIRKPALLPGIVLHDVVENLLPEADISEAKVPLSIVAVDLRSGHKVVLERGPLRDAVRASSALPGIFPPVEFEGMLLCDVGVFDAVPTIEARAYATGPVVAVDVASAIRPIPTCETALDVLMRMDEIGESLFRRQALAIADLVIRPPVADVEWFDFSTCERVLQAGRIAARQVMPLLRRRTAPMQRLLDRLQRFVRPSGEPIDTSTP